jgi:hypothetical protein
LPWKARCRSRSPTYWPTDISPWQIFAARAERNPSVREGVCYIAARRTEQMLFVTLEKPSRHYSPSTRYHDYAISNTLFH